MSIQNLSTTWAQYLNGTAAQSSGTTGTQNAQDWLNSLLNATGTTVGTDSSLSSATLSDQMQALLVQLQGGNTTAPDAASTTASAGGADTTATAATGHHHHHHHGGTNGVDQNADDVGADVASNLAGNDASGLDSTPGGFMQGVQNVVTSLGAAAIKGAAAGAVMGAI